VINFHCDCGQRIFFENTLCQNCGKILAFDPGKKTLLALSAIENNLLVSSDGSRYKHCKNHLDYRACNWLVDADSEEVYCVSCRLNKTIPNLTIPENLPAWISIEKAKRRLLYSVMSLKLPLLNKKQDTVNGLAFAFLEDNRHNSHVAEYLVLTGHHDGLITINLAEANDAYREQVRLDMGEPYRTVLGHFRHESGHYYFDRLIKHSEYLAEFRALFGDETRNYAEALEQYYAQNLNANWQHDFISAYAQVHPLEDWAECWAHYLHIYDTLETAQAHSLIAEGAKPFVLDQACINQWVELAISTNALNRSLGLKDAYPFFLSAKTIEKLQFIDRLIHR
jgi:hypothetical protein